MFCVVSRKYYALELKTDVLIAQSICSCLQCDSKLLFLSLPVLVSDSLTHIDRAPSVCVCVGVSTHMCEFGPSDTKLAQGLCHSLLSQRAFCSTTMLEYFVGHPAGGSRTRAQLSVRPVASLPFTILG